MLAASELHVAVGVISNAVGEVLIARRPEHLHQGGLWEFPGGKLEVGETVVEALRRELLEELDIELERASPLLQVRHAYPDRRVLLDVWRVSAYRGEPRGLENQPIRWVSPQQLPSYNFPAANRPITAAARLPDYYAILNVGSEESPEQVLAQLRRMIGQGEVRLVQLRAKPLDQNALQALLIQVMQVCRPLGIAVLLNGDPAVAMACGADGVHLDSNRLSESSHRPLPESLWVAASCHNPGELQQAERVGVDFVVLGPVLHTASHPDLAPLGWPRFREWVTLSNLPVFALGGLSPLHVDHAKIHGAQGIAGIRGFVPSS